MMMMMMMMKIIRRRDGGTNFILRIKEQETRLTLQEYDDDDELNIVLQYKPSLQNFGRFKCVSINVSVCL